MPLISKVDLLPGARLVAHLKRMKGDARNEKCDKSTSSQQEQFESWMGSIEAISNLIIEAREEIDNDRCLPKSFECSA